MDKKEKVNWNENINARTGIAIILLSALILGSILSIPHLNVLAQNQDNDSITDIETGAGADAEVPEEEIISSNNDTLADDSFNATNFNETESEPPSIATLADASLVTDKSTYSQGEPVSISLLSVPASATVNLTVTSPSSIICLVSEEETGSFTETTEIGEYAISAILSLEREKETLTTEFVVTGEEQGINNFNLNNATLAVDKATYAPGETVRIYLAAPPEIISNFSIKSPAGINYVISPSTSGDYEFKPDSAGTYVINVSLRAGDTEKVLTAEFDVLDLDLKVVFEEPEQGEIVVGKPVSWSQHISITNHENSPISDFPLTIPLPDGYSNLSSCYDDAGCKMHDTGQTCTLHPINIAAGESVSLTIYYQTPPVQLAVTEEFIDISELIPPEAFDIEIYGQNSAEAPSTEIPVKQVKVWHSSSIHYHDIPVTIEAEDCEQIVELVEGTGIEKEITAEQTASWTIPELSNKTYAVFAVEREQSDAEIDKPVEWQLNVSGTIVTYKTPAPYKTESAPVITNVKWKKEVTVGSNVSVHYSNVTAFSALDEIEKFNPRLFWLVNESRIDVTSSDDFNVSFTDTNANGILDFVIWTVPQLSNQSFEIEADITVINVQSYPTVGGNWDVRFSTTGKANLTITAVNGTTWTNQPYECYDAETEVLTKEGWKLFKDLKPEEEVLTLNPETKAQEWQKPLKYLEYDYSDAMFEITLADGSQLLVSLEHKVYGLMRDKSSSKSFVREYLNLRLPLQ
jgi:hypothetical protein